MKKAFFVKLALICGFLVGGSAFAVVDTSVAELGIQDAYLAILIVFAALINSAAAVYGVKKILKLVNR